MGNGLRCFLACVLPCGALDLIRVVHIDGHVDVYTRQVSAGEILKANPSHVLNKACFQGGVHRIIVVSPESDLKRGHIYFLVPTVKSSEEKKKTNNNKKTQDANVKDEMVVVDHEGVGSSEKKSCHRRRRSSDVRVGVWRPNLQSISEE